MANNVEAPNLSSSTLSELDVLSQEPTSEVVPITEKPKGRPAGSKNKPKPTRKEFPKPIILIVPAGMDIVNAIISFAHDHDVSILVHHASGTISEVNLCNPVSISDDLSFQGNLYMFSLSGFYTKTLSALPPKNIPFSFFNVQFSKETTPQLFGGLIGSKLIAAEPVHVVASIVKKHEYQEVDYPINNPNDQSVVTNASAPIMSNAIDDITDNSVNHPSPSVGASTSSQVNVQPFVAPTDTDQGDNY